MQTKINIGLIGVGLDTYWNQFAGLKNRLETYQQEIADNMAKFNATVINVGITDNQQKSIEMADKLKSANIEMLFVFISTYALSSTILPLAQRLKVPVIF